ncbi:MAG: hypothetical protein FWC32_00055 [Firmicutes bacterium]|nr:hypothetical protein [Bacillota bacterium]
MSNFKTQKALKLKPETLAKQVFEGEELQNILDFVQFLRANGMKPKLAAFNAWEVVVSKQNANYTNNQILRRLRIDPEQKTWSVNLHYFAKYADHIIDETVINFVWCNLYNKRCNRSAKNPDCNCRAIKSMMIFSKTFDNMCCNEQIRITNPSAKELEYIKELVSVAKNIVENKVATRQLDL